MHRPTVHSTVFRLGLLAFLSVVGGLLLFGPTGLILGPLTLTATTTLFEIWSDRTSLNGRGPGGADSPVASERWPGA